MEQQYDPYLIPGSRLELLEKLYALLVDTDAIFYLKEELAEDGEMDIWGELLALEYSLRQTK